jgi:hypothetical protein
MLPTREERDETRFKQFHYLPNIIDIDNSELPKLRSQVKKNKLEELRKNDIVSDLAKEDKELTRIQFNKKCIMRNIPVNDIDDLYTEYIKKHRAMKSKEMIIRDDVIPIRLTKPKSVRKKTDFSIYKQVKKYGLFVVAPSSDCYQMDIFYVKESIQLSHSPYIDDIREFKLAYLVMIGTNNRYSVVEATNVFDEYADFYAVSATQKDVKAIEIAIDKCLEKLREFNKNRFIIDCDGEKAFGAHNEKWLKERNMKLTPTPDRFHYRLSVVNRFIKTIRDKAKRYYDTIYIQPSLMNFLVEEYNNEIHSTLSGAIGFRVSPIQVIEDEEMEAFISKKLRMLNMKIHKKRDLEKGSNVSIMMPDFHKKFQLKDGYEIVEQQGENYVVKKGEEILVVPRLWIIPPTIDF